MSDLAHSPVLSGHSCRQLALSPPCMLDTEGTHRGLYWILTALSAVVMSKSSEYLTLPDVPLVSGSGAHFCVCRGSHVSAPRPHASVDRGCAYRLPPSLRGSPLDLDEESSLWRPPNPLRELHGYRRSHRTNDHVPHLVPAYLVELRGARCEMLVGRGDRRQGPGAGGRGGYRYSVHM